jgi:hypothetical protein
MSQRYVKWESKVDMIEIIVIVIVLAILSGCTTTAQGINRANSRFVGRNMDDFVKEYGMPIREFKLNDGSKVYRWSSEVLTYGLPSSTTFQATQSDSGLISGTSQTYGGGSINVFCEVDIFTTSDGTITAIKPVRDTLGKWTTSRCAEIFK